MDEHANAAGDGETAPDPYEKLRASKMWLDMIGDAEKCFETYQDKCDNIDKLYADLEKLSKVQQDREFQIFWANLEVVKPSIYARPPVPVVTSRFKDRKPVPQKAGEMLERSLVVSFDNEDIDSCMKHIRDDLAINARGVAWVRFQEDDEGIQRVIFDHVDRKDFVHDPARKWNEVDWVARRSWLSRERGIKRFGDEFTRAEFKEHKEEDEDKTYKGEKKACVWELWHKSKNVVVWVTKGVDDVLDVKEPFLDLDGFFPCPKPAYGTVQRRSLKPVPDFVYYKDQVEEINELTARISALSESLRMKGFYAAGNEDIGDAIETAMKQTDDNALLIPVPNFAALGGSSLRDSIIWLPVVEVAQTIQQLVLLRKQLIDDVYQISGISDIMRGQTDPTETLGAQELKSQYGSVRIRDRQEEMVRIARDMTRIAAEIMAENFEPQTLLSMSQVDDIASQQSVQQQLQQIQAQVAAGQMPPEQGKALAAKAQQQVTIEAVVGLLREQRVRPFILDIETDSTIRPDEDAEKQRRGEFLTAFATAMQQLTPLVQGAPEAAPFAGEVLKFAVAPFRAGKELDQQIDDFVEQMKQAAAQPKPDPEMEKMKADTELRQAEIKGKQELEAARIDLDRDKANAQLRLERQKIVASAADPEAVNRVNQVMETDMLETRALIEELRAGREQQEKMMTLLARALMAPKRVVRDEQGNPVGVEPVMETMQ